MDNSQLNRARAALAEAAHRAGTWSALAAICGCTAGNLSQLKSKGSPLPGRFVLKVELATGVSRHELRPDLYPIEDLPPGAPIGESAPIVPCDWRAKMKREGSLD